MSYIILGLLLFILYRFIFGFVLPVISASRKLQQRMKDMQQSSGGFSNTTSTQGYSTSSSSHQKESTPPSKDYIEFEEIK